MAGLAVMEAWPDLVQWRYAASVRRELTIHVELAVIALLVGFFLMWPLSSLFDRNNWPVFHTWGLAHGSAVIAWPVLASACYGILMLVTLPWRMRRER